MGLARLLTRAASPNVAPVSGGRPPMGPTQFMAGPEQQFPGGSGVMPPPTESQALSVPAFFRGLAYVCGSVGMLPVTAYRGTDAVDPQPPVIIQPDPNQSPMAFWSAVTESLVLYGNSINIITSRDRSGWPVTLKPIHPTLAAVRFTGNPMSPTIDAWYIAGQVYDPTDVWHVKSHLGRAGWPLGRGLIDLNGDAIAIGIALQSYAASYFAAGGMPTGILKVHRPEITQQQADDARSSWIAKYAGRPSVAVLNELTDFTPIAYNAVDSQMVESRQFSLIEFALLFGLPPSKLGANVGTAYKERPDGGSPGPQTTTVAHVDDPPRAGRLDRAAPERAEPVVGSGRPSPHRHPLGVPGVPGRVGRARSAVGVVAGRRRSGPGRTWIRWRWSRPRSTAELKAAGVRPRTAGGDPACPAAGAGRPTPGR